MTHEFRTPLNSILSLSRMLLDRMDGPLTPEQERQVRYVQRAAQDLDVLVNDLLDLAKVEAGKVAVRPGEFPVENLFNALRGIFPPPARAGAGDRAGLRGAARRFPPAVHGRRQGRPNFAQPRLQRPEVHCPRRGVGRGGHGGGERRRSFRRHRHRPGHRPGAPRANLRGVRPGGFPPAEAHPAAPAWVCRSPASSRACSAATSGCGASRGQGFGLHADPAARVHRPGRRRCWCRGLVPPRVRAWVRPAAPRLRGRGRRRRRRRRWRWATSSSWTTTRPAVTSCGPPWPSPARRSGRRRAGRKPCG